MKTKNKYIIYEDYLKQTNRYNQLRQKGLIPIYKRNWFKIGLGVVCLSIAIIPNGLGLIFYPLSFYLMGISLFDIKIKHLPNLKRIIKNKIRGLK